MGVNYRALYDLFDLSQSRRSTFAYEIEVQIVEIYNEQVRDLLSNNTQKRYPLLSKYYNIITLFFKKNNYNLLVFIMLICILLRI